MAVRDTSRSDSHSLARDVQSLVQSVRDLSDRITPPVNSEISQVFGRRGTSSQTRSTPSANVVSTFPATNTATSTSTSNWSSSSHLSSLPRGNVVSRYRRINNSRRIGSTINNRKSNKIENRVENKPFLCDIILLSGPKETSVPRQGTKLSLTERGHVITACRFNKNMNEIEVETTIHEAFHGIIPSLVDIEILVSRQ